MICVHNWPYVVVVVWPYFFCAEFFQFLKFKKKKKKKKKKKGGIFNGPLANNQHYATVFDCTHPEVIISIEPSLLKTKLYIFNVFFFYIFIFLFFAHCTQGVELKKIFWHTKRTHCAHTHTHTKLIKKKATGVLATEDTMKISTMINNISLRKKKKKISPSFPYWSAIGERRGCVCVL